MKANEVIRIGRSRSRQAPVSPRDASARARACLGELDDQDGVLAGQADEHDEADLREDVDVRVCGHRHQTPTIEPSRHIGTTRMTAKGSVQLSYWAASTRNTRTHGQDEQDHGRVAGAGWRKEISVHSYAMACGSSCCASFCMASMASPELTPGGSVAVDRQRRDTCCNGR